MSLDLIYALNEQGMRIFTTQDVYALANTLKVKHSYIPMLLSNLAKKGVIHNIIKGKYVLDNNVLSGDPLHEFEIATSFYENSAIAYLSAMIFHNLTDQVPNKVYSISFSLKEEEHTHEIRRYINHHEYWVIKTRIKNKWGIEASFINESRVYVTDLERTLLDGLSKPQYCLGIRETLHAFELAGDRIDLEKIYDYALSYGTIALVKRLGLVLEKIGLNHSVIPKLQAVPATVYQKLDIHGEKRGKYNKKWMIIENI